MFEYLSFAEVAMPKQAQKGLFLLLLLGRMEGKECLIKQYFLPTTQFTFLMTEKDHE